MPSSNMYLFGKIVGKVYRYCPSAGQAYVSGEKRWQIHPQNKLISYQDMYPTYPLILPPFFLIFIDGLILKEGEGAFFFLFRTGYIC